MAAITLSFDLPYCIRIDGKFTLKTDEDAFDLTLSTYYEPNPTMPGAEVIQNVAILNDEGSSISHTVVRAEYTPSNTLATDDPNKFMSTLPSTAIKVSNALIAGLREAYEEYAIEYIYSAARIGPISCTGAINGQYDSLAGGITFQTPSRRGEETASFASFLAAGARLSIEREMYFDARRYLLRGNKRMALANLVISFEVRLASLLKEIATSRGDVALENEISGATLAPLGQGLAKRALGESLENSAFWGNAAVDTFVWIRTARNKVLHQAQMAFTIGGRTRDFNIIGELKDFFIQHDQLVRQLTSATSRVLAGQSAKP